MWIDLCIAIMFTLRTVWYFLMVADDYTAKSRKDYFECNKFTCFGLVACGLAEIMCKWFEWGHYPLWALISWTMWGAFQAYHWYIVRSHADMDESWGPLVTTDEMLKKDDDLRMEYVSNKIQ